MRRSLLALALPLLCGCSMQPIEYGEPSALDTPAATSVKGLAVPKPEPIREPFTAIEEVKSGSGVLGYLVTYEIVPAYARARGDAERRYPTGTVLVQDREFHLIGFMAPNGRSYRFRGTATDEIGQGTVDQMLPEYFPTAIGHARLK